MYHCMTIGNDVAYDQMPVAFCRFKSRRSAFPNISFQDGISTHADGFPTSRLDCGQEAEEGHSAPLTSLDRK